MLKQIPVNDIKLAVYEAGEGVPILLVHGFPLDHSMWLGQIEALSKRYRVIAPDLRGFGESNGALHIVPMTQFAKDLSGLLKAMNIEGPVTYCGLSMGGYIAWQFAKHHADQLGRLILCDTKATADTESAQETRRKVARKVLEEGPEFLAGSMLTKLFSDDSRSRIPQVIQHTKDVIQMTSARAIAGASLGMAERPNMTETLKEITCPTLSICGSEDILTTVDEMESFSQEIPNCQFVTIPEAGHMAPLEKPMEVNEVILQFLGDTDV